uniref:Secreted protein n=1 Tax=Strongyloides venezuelensis TaxID=75913 RepID=A0A0K0FFC4_STRVS
MFVGLWQLIFVKSSNRAVSIILSGLSQRCIPSAGQSFSLCQSIDLGGLTLNGALYVIHHNILLFIRYILMHNESVPN